MQAKQYQQRALDALDDYLSKLAETSDMSAAFESAQQVEGGYFPKRYQNSLPGVPQLTYKVPTGGGKTFLAAASLRSILGWLPSGQPKVVAWLAPTDAILTQTLRALRDENHPYRQRINRDFQGHVEVYSKDELLAGQNFTIGAVAGQLSIMVLSYDSFRRNGDGLRAYEENGALMSFTSAFPQVEFPIENAHPSSLFQVINQLNPVVVVDESHRATSTLSMAMMRNFNPCFTLSLTATPANSANILVYVRASELKAEEMVKLPVMVVNRSTQTEVVADAIDLRAALESKAKAVHSAGAPYCRPIALVQAEPRGDESALTFEAVRTKLCEAGVPREHIAIKTATVDELRDVDLLSPGCPIRFIITVNALKEGWDCPFAYILAALANKNSSVDVEQVVGRILRQPNARRFSDQTLNMSYVLTGSNQFKTVVEKVVAGLNEAGFTRDDIRVRDVLDDLGPDVDGEPVASTEDGSESNEAEEGVLDFDAQRVAERTTTSPSGDENPTQSDDLLDLLRGANRIADQYDAQVELDDAADISSDTHDEMSSEQTGSGPRGRQFQYMMRRAFLSDTKDLLLPQFVLAERSSFLVEENPLLEPSILTAKLSLRGRATMLNLGDDRDSFRTIDVDEDNVPRWGVSARREHDLIYRYLNALPDNARLNAARESIITALDNAFDGLPSSELRRYVGRVVEDMDGDQRVILENQPQRVAEAVKTNVRGFQVAHAKSEFQTALATGELQVTPTYRLPKGFNFGFVHDSIARSLYEGEARMNTLEMDLVTEISSMRNIRWWHRNPSKTGFRINGFINHYPDFIVRTEEGRIVLVETKSDHLNADDSRQRLDVGTAWQNLAGERFRYFMVFRDGADAIDSSHTFTPFLDILRRL